MQRIRSFAAVLAAVAAVTTARAQTDTTVRVDPDARVRVESDDRPILGASRSNWPTELTQRPLTLDAGMAELYVPVNVNLSKGADGKPVTSNPSLYYGVTSRWMIGVRHMVGLCMSGTDNGCDKAYNDVSLDTLFSLGRSSGLDLGVGFSLNYAPIDPAAWSGEARLVARAGGGSFAITVAPMINFGLNDRDNRTKWAGGTFNLGTYNLVRAIPDTQNREIVSVPGTLQLQFGPSLALVGGIAIEGPVNPSVGDFGDYYRVPVTAGIVLTPIRWVDIGASLTFPDLLGKSDVGTDFDNADFRVLGIFAALRI
jgi:hypothetical protein